MTIISGNTEEEQKLKQQLKKKKMMITNTAEISTKDHLKKRKRKKLGLKQGHLW